MGLSKEDIEVIVGMLYEKLKGEGTGGSVGKGGKEDGDGKRCEEKVGGEGEGVTKEKTDKSDEADNNGAQGSKKKKKGKKQATIACDDGGAFTVVPLRHKRKTDAKTTPGDAPNKPANPATTDPTPTNPTTTTPEHKLIKLREGDWPVPVCRDARHARDLGGVAFVPAAKFGEAVAVSDKARPFLVVTAYPPKTELPVKQRTVPVVQGGKTVCKTVYVTEVGKRAEGECVALSGPLKTRVTFQNGTEVLRISAWETHSGDTWASVRDSAEGAKGTFHKWVCENVIEIPKDWVFAVQLIGKGLVEAKVRIRKEAVAKMLAQSGQGGIFTASWDRTEPVLWLKDMSYKEVLVEAKRRGVVMGVAAKAKAIGLRVGTEEERVSLQKMMGEAAVVRDTRMRFVLRGLPYGISQDQLEEVFDDMTWLAQVVNLRANNALVAAAEEPPSRVFDLDGTTVRVDDFSPKAAAVTRAKEWSYLAVASGSAQPQTAAPTQTKTHAKERRTEVDELRDENKALKDQLTRMEAQLAAITKALSDLQGAGFTNARDKEEDVTMKEVVACDHQWGKLTYPHNWKCFDCETNKNKGTVQYVCEGCRVAVCPECKKGQW